jgi:hypothetical protein
VVPIHRTCFTNMNTVRSKKFRYLPQLSMLGLFVFPLAIVIGGGWEVALQSRSWGTRGTQVEMQKIRRQWPTSEIPRASPSGRAIPPLSPLPPPPALATPHPIPPHSHPQHYCGITSSYLFWIRRWWGWFGFGRTYSAAPLLQWRWPREIQKVPTSTAVVSI